MKRLKEKIRKGISPLKPGATTVHETPRVDDGKGQPVQFIEGKYARKLLITTDGQNVDISYSDLSLMEIIGICHALSKSLGIGKKI
jgi:hypothetical protein